MCRRFGGWPCGGRPGAKLGFGGGGGLFGAGGGMRLLGGHWLNGKPPPSGGGLNLGAAFGGGGSLGCGGGGGGGGWRGRMHCCKRARLQPSGSMFAPWAKTEALARLMGSPLSVPGCPCWVLLSFSRPQTVKDSSMYERGRKRPKRECWARVPPM